MTSSATSAVRHDVRADHAADTTRPLPRDSLADRVLSCVQGADPQRSDRVATATAQWLDEAARRNPGRTDACLEGIASVLVRAERLGLDAIPALSELLRQAGGERLSSATFRMLLLDIADRAGRLPAKPLLSLCRGLALGVSLRGEGRLLPPLLRDAALHVFQQLELPATRRTAMAEALLLNPR